ncbi:MAG: hypothetical protein AAFW68_08830 [Pseudomonadota bacterium]
MHMMTRILSAMPRNKTLPLILLFAGWYGGAKYGAPDAAMAAVDNALARGGAMIEVLLAESAPAPAIPGEDV